MQTTMLFRETVWAALDRRPYAWPSMITAMMARATPMLSSSASPLGWRA